MRFRRPAAVVDAVREAVRDALATGGFLRPAEEFAHEEAFSNDRAGTDASTFSQAGEEQTRGVVDERQTSAREAGAQQEAIEFGWTPAGEEIAPREGETFARPPERNAPTDAASETLARNARAASVDAREEGDGVLAGEGFAGVENLSGRGRRAADGRRRRVWQSVGQEAGTPVLFSRNPRAPAAHSASKLVRGVGPARSHQTSARSVNSKRALSSPQTPRGFCS